MALEVATGHPVETLVVAERRDLPADQVNHRNGAEWTTVKVLRRLAWHEIGELVVLRRLLARARFALRAAG